MSLCEPPDLEVTPVKRMRRDQRDAIVLFGIAAAAFVFSDIYDIPHYIFEFGMKYEHWKVDDIIFVIFVLGVSWMIYGFRRYQDVSHEIKTRISAELEARALARHDPLTGLPNRRFFAEKLDEYLRGANDTQRLAVLMLDLDGFKTVNDRYGHAAGDKALSEFARRVAILLRAGSVLARIGGCLLYTSRCV